MGLTQRAGLAQLSKQHMRAKHIAKIRQHPLTYSDGYILGKLPMDLSVENYQRIYLPENTSGLFSTDISIG